MAHAGQVFIQFFLVAAAEVALEVAGIIHDEVEDAAIFSDAVGVGGAEEAIEDGLWIPFWGDRHGFRFPGEVKLVGAGIPRIAISGFAGGIAADFQRWQFGEAAEVIGRHLIDGHAGPDVGAGGFARLATGEKGRIGAGVITAAVAIGIGGF